MTLETAEKKIVPNPSSDRIRRVFEYVSVSVLGLLLLLFVLYKLVGFDGLVRDMYEGNSFGILNELIKYQDTKPVEHYINLANILFQRGVFLFFILLGYIYLLVRALFYKKSPHVIWVFLLGTVVIVGVNLINPNNRIYSSHGFLHTGIVYELLQGFIPPANPLFAGETLYWPWGQDLLPAVLVKFFGIPPSWAFCVINIISILGIVLVIDRICGLLTDNDRASVLASFVPLFSVAFMHERGVPIFERLLNITGMPLGVFFNLLFVYSVLQIFKQTKIHIGYIVLLFVSVLGVGFLYFQLLPGVLGCFGLFLCYKSICLIRSRKCGDWSRVLFSALSVSLATAILIPYLLSVSTNSEGKVEILSLPHVLQNFQRFLRVSAAMMILIIIGWRSLRTKFDQMVLLDFAILTIGVLCVYLSLHIPAGNEYKWMSQYVIQLGIVGGALVALYDNRKSKIVAFVLLIVLGNVFFNGTLWKLKKVYSAPRLYESWTRIYTRTEEDELYEWILENTKPHTPVIDLDMKVPCLGQRPLYAGMDKIIDGEVQKQPGYGISIVYLCSTIGSYDETMINFRYDIMKSIYGFKSTAEAESTSGFFSKNPNVIVVERESQLIAPVVRENLELVFESSNKNYSVYVPKPH